jgi:hypothetical protein
VDNPAFVVDNHVDDRSIVKRWLGITQTFGGRR